MRAGGAAGVTTGAPGRLVGLDVARCLALLGMVATHVLPARTPGGDLALGQAVAGGRSAALFAVLAGISLALMTGGTDPVRGRTLASRAVGLVVRAVLIAALGLVLGMLDTGIAVILAYYGVLFGLGTAFLALRARTLALLAAAWVVLGPVVSHLVRPHLPERGYASPHPGQLADPLQLLSELTFTGYYPAVPWLAYLLVGMALGRTDLRDRWRAASIAVWGAALAVVALIVSTALAGSSDVVTPELGRIETGMFGQTPVGGPWDWLLVVAPHSTTPFDLAHTAGSALAVLGVCLLLVGLLGRRGRRTVAVVFGAGTMTLTLYSLHVVLRSPGLLDGDTTATFLAHVGVVLAVGALLVALGRRGPLERAVTAAARAAGRLVPG